MKKLILILLLALPLFGQTVDHKLSWPKLELGVATGTGAQAALVGGSNDEVGTIVLWTGENCCPTGGGSRRVLVVYFGQQYPDADTLRPVITPVSEDAAELFGDSAVYVDQVHISRLYWEIAIRSGGLKKNKAYAWNYQVK